MRILTIKTGTEKHANRLFSTKFFLIPKGDKESIELINHPTYMAHEQIICGLNGCLGKWEIGHVSLSDGQMIMGLLTRKILAYDPHSESNLYHFITHVRFKVGGIKDRQYTQNYWGYNGGKEISALIKGRYDFLGESKKRYPLTTPLYKLPF